jgi:hypothetical protein
LEPSKQSFESALEVGVGPFVTPGPLVHLGIGPSRLLDLDRDAAEDERPQ